MTDVHTLERARRLFDQRSWADSYCLLDTADRDASLEPEDLERFARAIFDKLGVASRAGATAWAYQRNLV